MLLFTSTILWIFNIVNINGLVLQNTYNDLLTDSADYTLDLIINEDDYEMIDKKQLKELNIHVKKHQFIELDGMASVENNRSLEYKMKNITPPNSTIPAILVVTDKYNKIMTTYIGSINMHTFSKSKRDTTIENETEYDYEKLANEYYDEANKEAQMNNTYHINKSVTDTPEYGALNSLKEIFLLKTDNQNCTNIKGIGLQAIKCLVEDYTAQRQSTKDVAVRLWKIAQIWFLVYLAVAVPLWCTRGWCCCCLCCKFFKPRQTIEEAKKFVVAYPPGVFKTKNGEVRYEASEREKECYEEFEHFIKTL